MAVRGCVAGARACTRRAGVRARECARICAFEGCVVLAARACREGRVAYRQGRVACNVRVILYCVCVCVCVCVCAWCA